MSDLSIQVSQCGNPVRRSVHKVPTLSNSILNTYFHVENQKIVPNVVLIDMEPKVVNSCLSLKRAWQYDSSSVFCQQEGSGNNWAFGYKIHGIKWKETILDKIRKNIEKSDLLRCVMLYLSLAGGTGPGVGTSIAENVRDEFDVNLLNIAVWPYSFGEVIPKHYNTDLKVSHLASAVDGMLII